MDESGEPRPLAPLCSDCGGPMEKHDGEWLCADALAFERAWDAFYWNRRDPSVPLEDR